MTLYKMWKRSLAPRSGPVRKRALFESMWIV